LIYRALRPHGSEKKEAGRWAERQAGFGFAQRAGRVEKPLPKAYARRAQPGTFFLRWLKRLVIIYIGVDIGTKIYLTRIAVNH